MKKLIILISILTICFTTCKKKEQSTSNISIVEPCTCTTNKYVYPNPNLSLCNGFFTYRHYFNYLKDYDYTQSFYLNVSFNNQANYYEYGNYVQVNSVSLNNNFLSNGGNGNTDPTYFYGVNGNDLYNHNFLWKVNGANGIPSFTFSSEDKEPSANLNGLPGTISISDFKAFSVNQVGYVTDASISLTVVKGNNYSSAQVNLYNGSNCVCFPEGQLKYLNTGKGQFSISLNYYTIQKIDSKNFKFIKTVQYTKPVTVVP